MILGDFFVIFCFFFFLAFFAVFFENLIDWMASITDTVKYSESALSIFFLISLELSMFNMILTILVGRRPNFLRDNNLYCARRIKIDIT